MLSTPEFLVARVVPGLVPVEDGRGALRVLIASLARGGAERIVLDWLDAECRRGRDVELAVVHRRAHAWAPPRGARVRWRAAETPEAFVRALGHAWRGGPPVSCHLVPDALLALLWEAGVETVPVVHNSREGWRNDPALWNPARVPRAIACAEAVRAQVLAAGCAVPVHAVRHVPSVGREAFDEGIRRAVRRELGVPEGALLVGSVGAFKPQKDYPRAVAILAALRRRREAVLVILGGLLDRAQLAELDRTLEAAIALGVADHLRLPGFVDPVARHYAACDALLNASRHEGFSMASREALVAGLPVVATAVGGQEELAHPGLELLPRDAPPEAFAARLERLPVRERLAGGNAPRAPRIWSVGLAPAARGEGGLETIFVTANLNAGGAQRSLVNLAGAMSGRHRFGVAVCAESTHPAFPERLRALGVPCWRPAASPDPFALAESLLERTARSGARALCFWNADPRVKLLVAKFAPPRLRLVDACPGDYAFAELEREADFGRAASISADEYYGRLDVLVLKYRAPGFPAGPEVVVIPNGVAVAPEGRAAPGAPRFLVSGRIAPSKHLGTVIEAFARVHAGAPGAELHIVGQAEPRHHAYAAGLAEGARGLPVFFRGAGPDLAHLAEPFTAAVVLGTHQGCPNAVLEAMAAGIPVIANASGGTGELVEEGVTGCLLPEAPDAGALAAAMSRVAAEPQAAARWSERARERVRREHGLERMAARYLAVLGAPA